MANGFKVNEKTRTVKVYRLSLDEKDYKVIERYKALDYDVIMIEKKEPQKKAGLKADDLKKYLDNGIIPTEIYKEMIERLKKKQNFLRVKSWLITALKNYAEENKTEYRPITEIIQEAREQENLKNSIDQEKTTKKEDKTTSKVVGITETTSKNK